MMGWGSKPTCEKHRRGYCGGGGWPDIVALVMGLWKVQSCTSITICTKHGGMYNTCDLRIGAVFNTRSKSSLKSMIL